MHNHRQVLSRFDGDHHLAIILTRYLDPGQAKKVCLQEGWFGVLDALHQQLRLNGSAINAASANGSRGKRPRRQ